ncbi:glycosyltransferase [Pseudonocardia pini]|uniref:glycosyltransferase n=1 Tax=Pseudonocardia pini TaxID=2758030 RepID=UPI0015F037F2|nr:glycosyltransferase [Pseudonocardia pini]
MTPSLRNRDALPDPRVPHFRRASPPLPTRESDTTARESDTLLRESDTTAPESDIVLPFTSVVVPSIFARGEQLLGSVEALAALDHPAFEIVVVDNRAVPETADWAPLLALPGVRVISEPRRGISAARNAGVRAARGEIIAFTDDDVRVDRTWLRALTGRFVTEPGVAAVLGLVVAGELETAAQLAFEDYDPLVGSQFTPSTRALDDAQAPVWSPRRYRVAGRWLYQLGGVMGANMAFRAAALAAVGEFDTALGTGTRTRGGEDLDIVTRLLFAGHRVGYEPSALLWHTHRRTDAELRTQMYGYGTGFTAMLAAAVRREPRHLVGLALAVLGVVAGRFRRSAQAGTPDLLPADLRALERRGQLAGPFTYVAALRGRR